MNINTAIAQGNAMTQQNADYNERINKARDDVNNFYTSQLQKDKGQKTVDDAIFGVQDAIASASSGAKLGALTDAYKDYNNSENISSFLGKHVVPNKIKSLSQLRELLVLCLIKLMNLQNLFKLMVVQL